MMTGGAGGRRTGVSDGMIRGFDTYHWKHGDVTGRAAIEMRFDCTFPEGCDILFAYNECYGYEERCVVIWREPDGRIAMVEDSHCSCNDYEGGMERSGYPTARELGMANWGWISDDEARGYLQTLIGEWIRKGLQPAASPAGRWEREERG